MTNNKAETKIIIKIISLNEKWYCAYVIPGTNINNSIEDEKQLAQFRYPEAQQIFIIPVFYN